MDLVIYCLYFNHGKCSRHPHLFIFQFPLCPPIVCVLKVLKHCRWDSPHPYSKLTLA